MKNKRLIIGILSGILIVVLFYISVPVDAQGVNNWAVAKIIPSYEDEFPPILVADQQGVVHAFNSMLDGDAPVIFYRNWMIDQGWSQPVDILLPDSNANQPLQDVTLDKSGFFHMIFFGGTPEDGNIQYTRAYYSGAYRSQSWASPIDIGRKAGPLDSAAMIGDGTNTLVVLYCGQKDGIGLYEVHSTDGGQTWSSEEPIFMVREKQRWPHHIKMEVDESGRFHAVWSVINQNGMGEEVYYARRDTDGHWSDPFLLAAREGNDYAADWPSIIDYKGELIVIYMDGTIPTGVPPTRWMRRSSDGGTTWTAPVRPFTQVGEHGFTVLLIDSNEQLHIILANRIDNPLAAGIWHGIWLGNRWSELELITARTQAQAIAIGSYKDVGSASRPVGAISLGNTILSAWWHDGVEGVAAGYSYVVLNAPALPMNTYPTPMTTPSTLQTPTQSAQLSALNPTPTLLFLDQNTGSTATGTSPILISMITVIVLITITFLFTRRLHRNAA